MTSSLSKRKVEDYADDALPPMINPAVTRKDHSALSSSSPHPPLSPRPRSGPAHPSSPARLQFFVRMLSDHTLVIHADPFDTIKSIHEMIQSITGIPVIEQRLIYRGNQLQWEQTVAECGVQNDALLQLVGRMRSTRHPQACQLINDVVSLLFYLYKNNPLPPCFTVNNRKTVKSMLLDFLRMTPRTDSDQASGHLQIFSTSSAPAALIQEHVERTKKHDDDTLLVGRQYLSLLKELNSTSKLYHGCEEVFWEIMKQRRSALCYLIVRCAKRIDDHNWIYECKEVTDFEARRHLAMMLLPEVKDDFDELHEILIDRSNLLAESFDYIMNADLESLRAGLFVEFKNEEATGPGVLREWFFCVCQAIFNPQNSLFLACSNDRRRFLPNPASTVDPLDCEYFNFAGKVIALALMHKVQVGVAFDRVFFLQLAGHTITLEDISDADPCLYNGCKQILEMDAEAVDQDALCLTFVHEIEELGTRRVVELCPGGKSLVVNSTNRREYVDYLIQLRFVKEIAEQVDHFAKGFADILSCRRLQKSFFQRLNPEDLDLMLLGSEYEISVDDWKAHTECYGFKETDAQISWFWEIVGNMTKEQKNVLLFFWTSIKYLPPQGFRGLSSRLYIHKNSGSSDRLPSSHTCFYRLTIPSYPSMTVMRDRLNTITQEHLSSSFGTW